MNSEWDSHKAASNLTKHGVDFADAVTAAVTVLQDPLALTIPDVESEESRFVTLGTDATGRLLVVAYAWRGGAGANHLGSIGDSAGAQAIRGLTSEERVRFSKR